MTMAMMGFALLATHGICRETVKRPVVRFIDFYISAANSERPVSVFTRIFNSLAVATYDEPETCPMPPSGM